MTTRLEDECFGMYVQLLDKCLMHEVCSVNLIIFIPNTIGHHERDNTALSVISTRGLAFLMSIILCCRPLHRSRRS